MKAGKLLRAATVALPLGLICAIQPVQAQNLFDEDRLKECYEVLGLGALAIVEGVEAVTKIREHVEASAADMDRVIQNIEGDFALARDFGALSEYEYTYLFQAMAERERLQRELDTLKKQLECWKYFERVLKLAKLKRPPAPPSSSLPEQEPKPPKPPEDPDPLGLDEIFKLAKEYFDRRAQEVARLEKRARTNEKNIRQELVRRQQRTRKPQVRLPEPPVYNPFAPFDPFIEVGAGGNIPADGSDLDPFNQFTDRDPGFSGMFGVGVGTAFLDDLQFQVILRATAGTSTNDRLKNKGGGAALNTSGVQSYIGFVPTAAVTFPVAGLFSLKLFAGAGVAYQKFTLKNGGVTVAKADGTSFIWQAGGGFRVPLGQSGVCTGIDVVYTGLSDIDGRTNTATPFNLDGASDVAINAVISVPFSRLGTGSAAVPERTGVAACR